MLGIDAHKRASAADMSASCDPRSAVDPHEFERRSRQLEPGPA